MYEYLEDDSAFWTWLSECESLCERMGLVGDWFDRYDADLLDEYYTTGLSPQQAVEQGLVLYFTELRSRII